jgi:predicted secreted protein
MTLLVPVPTANVAAIKPNHDGFGWRGHDLLRRLSGLLSRCRLNGSASISVQARATSADQDAELAVLSGLWT